MSLISSNPCTAGPYDLPKTSLGSNLTPSRPTLRPWDLPRIAWGSNLTPSPFMGWGLGMAILCTGGLDVIRKEAWPFYRTSSGVCLCWELKEPKGPEGLRGEDSVWGGA